MRTTAKIVIFLIRARKKLIIIFKHCLADKFRSLSVAEDVGEAVWRIA